MTDTYKQSPLGANATSGFLNNIGFNINPVAQSYMGISKQNATYTVGEVVNNTCLRLLTYAIYHGYNRGLLTNTIYNNLITIGSSYIPALGNTKPSTYTNTDPSGEWTGEANTGYGISGATGQGQSAVWYIWSTSNPDPSITQWGFIRLFALQAWNEFNFNGIPSSSSVTYKDFLSSFMTCTSFVQQTNLMINAFYYGPTYLNGVYSNMNDLISADITNVSLSTQVFGQDCIALGKAIDLTKIYKFGLPSVLLQTLRKYNGITQALSLALLASGLLPTAIENISSNKTNATLLEEQQIYGAFLIIVGQDLNDCLVPINCKTIGLTSLADLLNIQKMFPKSYQTLTVPIYNTAQSVNNSKTYYPIFDGISVSSRINTPAIKEIIGTIIPKGVVFTRENSTENIQELPKGFDSYLLDILPTDLALSAGAFAYAMQQIKNILYIDFEKFSQVAFNIETVKSLNLVNGTNIPANTSSMNNGTTKVALGSGPNQSYTISDFFGSMSGLPYNWTKLQSLIQNLQTTKLSNIYLELYLAVTWENATLSLTIEEYSPGLYRIGAINITDDGGGYGRGTAVAPIITLNNGATATCTIGTDSSNLSTFGKVTLITITNAGSSASNLGWTVTIQSPPTATLAVQSNGNRSTSGTNTSPGTVAWPSPMQTVVDDYITQANTEIQDIYNTNFNLNSTFCADLINLYNQFGSQLTIEQRARYIALAPVPIPRDTKLNSFPNTQLAFADSLPDYAQNLIPHMQAQTIESIANLNIVEGQSIVGFMREQRNRQRLQAIGIEQDNLIPGYLEPTKEKELLCNGVTTYIVNGNTITTTPSTEIQQINNVNQTPERIGTLLMPGSALPNQNNTNNIIFNNIQNSSNSNLPVSNPYVQIPVIQQIQAPIYVVDNVPLDLGQAVYPGSFAGSKAINLIPNDLNTTFTSGNQLSPSFSVQEAIDDVIHCNCECWIT